MTEPLPCPTCGEALEYLRQDADTASAGVRFVWKCLNDHWWSQTARFGFLPMDSESVDPIVEG